MFYFMCNHGLSLGLGLKRLTRESKPATNKIKEHKLVCPIHSRHMALYKCFDSLRVGRFKST